MMRMQKCTLGYIFRHRHIRVSGICAVFIALLLCMTACENSAKTENMVSEQINITGSEMEPSQTVTDGELPEVITFGTYPQQSEEAEPIEWLVLDRNEDEVMLLSKDCLASLPWHNSHVAATWDKSDIRDWLNGTFLDTAFSEEERANILLSSLENGDDLNYGTTVGESTNDLVFLLSASEALALLQSSDRTAKPTSHAISQGAYTNANGNCAWWLRSPGMTEAGPAYFASAGEIGSRAHEVNETIIGVRPAIRIRYSREILSEGELSTIAAGETAVTKSIYTDGNGDFAYIPADFTVSAAEGEQTVSTGLVVIGPDGSEFVWIPTTSTEFSTRDFGSYFSPGSSFSNYHDETELDSLDTYQEMVASVEQYGGFYLGRYEASKGKDGLPRSKRVTNGEPGTIWVQFSPQDTTAVCQKLYADNDTVQGFFPWGINWDTALQWLIDSGCKAKAEVVSDSTGWGNYSDDDFSPKANGKTTGAYEEAKANNIYDLAGNNWEWTQERNGSDYVMRGGGYNLMGGACSGARYPAALRDPLPGNNHHPNVTFRVGLFVK